MPTFAFGASALKGLFKGVLKVKSEKTELRFQVSTFMAIAATSEKCS